MSTLFSWAYIWEIVYYRVLAFSFLVSLILPSIFLLFAVCYVLMYRTVFVCLSMFLLMILATKLHMWPSETATHFAFVWEPELRPYSTLLCWYRLCCWCWRQPFWKRCLRSPNVSRPSLRSWRKNDRTKLQTTRLNHARPTLLELTTVTSHNPLLRWATFIQCLFVLPRYCTLGSLVLMLIIMIIIRIIIQNL